MTTNGATKDDERTEIPSRCETASALTRSNRLNALLQHRTITTNMNKSDYSRKIREKNNVARIFGDIKLTVSLRVGINYKELRGVRWRAAEICRDRNVI